MPPARAARRELLARLLFDRLLVHGDAIDGDAEQQELRGVEALGAWAVETAEDRQHLGLVLLLQGFDAASGFLPDLCDGTDLPGDGRITLGQFLPLPADDRQQHLRVRGKLVHAQHGGLSTTAGLWSASG